MPRPAAVLLDFDDTLVDNSVVPASVERACQAIGAAVGTVDSATLLRANTEAWVSYWPGVERECWLGHMDVPDISREVWRRALRACGCDDPSIVAVAYDTHQLISQEMDRLFDDVPELLASLQEAKVKTALVSNSSTRSQQARLEAVGLARSFDAVVISGEIGAAKPDPAIFEVALDRLELTGTGVWHVGDSLSTDVAGASAARLGSVWLNREQRVRGPADPLPDVEVTSLRRLLALLLAA